MAPVTAHQSAADRVALVMARRPLAKHTRECRRPRQIALVPFDEAARAFGHSAWRGRFLMLSARVVSRPHVSPPASSGQPCTNPRSICQEELTKGIGILANRFLASQKVSRVEHCNPRSVRAASQPDWWLNQAIKRATILTFLGRVVLCGSCVDIFRCFPLHHAPTCCFSISG